MSLNFKNLDVSSLDYSDIVTSLKTFLKQEPTLADLDYYNNGICVNMLINILATATAYNGVYAQFGYKESFASTATLLSSILGLASNSSVLIPAKQSAFCKRNIATTSAVPPFSTFSGISSNNKSFYFFNIDQISAGTVGSAVNFYAGTEAVQYTNWDYNTQSITIPLTVDPNTIKMYSVDTSGNTITWTKVDKSNISLVSTNYYYTVVNTVNGYLVSANLPESFKITTDYSIYCRAVISNGSEGNNAIIDDTNVYGLIFLTDEEPLNGYDYLTAASAKAKLNFEARAKQKCVTLEDYENAMYNYFFNNGLSINTYSATNGNEPCTVYISASPIADSDRDSLMTYLSERSVAGINTVFKVT